MYVCSEYSPFSIHHTFRLGECFQVFPTTLWDNYPEAIAWALDQHNCILRRLFAEFDGYEVKTIGDAFMVWFSAFSVAVTPPNYTPLVLYLGRNSGPAWVLYV